MKPSTLLLALSVISFSSCSTSYKTGQTPDDVYYSAAKPQAEDEYVESEKKDDRQYRYDEDYYDDRYLRMKVRNRYRWSDLDDWYSYDRYSIGYNYYYGSYNNPYYLWNYYYNPYCCCHNTVYLNTKYTAYQPTVKSRFFSLSGYNNNNFNNSNNAVYKTPGRANTKTEYNNANGLGNKIRTIFSNNNSGSSSRSYSPSSGSSNNSGGSSGSSGKSGSSGSVSRPVRN